MLEQKVQLHLQLLLAVHLQEGKRRKFPLSLCGN